jgi:hypothetical protein
MEPRVYEVTTDGTLVRQFGSFGNGPGQLNTPNDIAVGADGSLYVAQANLAGANAPMTIKKFTATGGYVGELSTQIQPMALALQGDGLFVLDGGPRGLVRVDLRAPIAAIAPTGAAASGRAGTSQQVTFDASGSSMPFGSVTRYEWDLDGDGSFETDTGTVATASRRYAAEGARSVRVRVTGSTGGTDVAAVELSVARSSVRLGAVPAQVVTSAPTQLVATPTAVADSQIENVRWDLDGDGSFEADGGTGLTVSHAWATPGVRTVGVRVERSGGVVDTATTHVTVVAAPPAGPIGVTINDAAQYTNDPNVTLSIVWPAFTTNLLLSNDGGFRAATGHAPAARIQWRLDASGPERLPKTVYVRFDGSSQTYTDDIILDQTAPTVQAATATAVTARAAVATTAAKKRGKKRRAPRAKAYRVRVKASDRTSGVGKLQFAVDKRKPAKALRYRTTLTVRGAKPKFVRAIDRAGNVSRWKPLR